MARRPKRPRVVFGSRGPFLGPLDLGLLKWSLPLDELDTHIYVVGRSGKGKSKFLEGLLWQLINLGQGCGLIDPHGDLANHLLQLLAFQPTGREQRPWLDNPANFNRLLYCEPGRDDFFVPMNVLAGPDKPYAKASNVIEAFQRTWSHSLWEAPQFKNVALHSLLLLLEHELTLVHLPTLLTDKYFRRALLHFSDNRDVVAFFENRFDKWGKEQSLRIESLLNKVTALTLNDSLRLMLGAKENRLSLRPIMDGGQILIANLGTCDLETRNLLGSLLTVGLEQAAMSRIELEPSRRRPWFCVLDEFQWFVASEGSTQVLAQMLSEVRKMGLRLCLAHQGWQQLDSTRLEGALDQAQLKVIFGSGARTAQALAEELFVPDPRKIKHEVADPQAQERTHPFYENLLEQREVFMQYIRSQQRRRVLLSPPESDRTIPLRTLTIPRPAFTPEQFEAVKVRLLKKIGEPKLGTSVVLSKKPFWAEDSRPVEASGIIEESTGPEE
ncbi:MAG: hypothetical protein L0332_30805 [Chloroflexi bacterium]|nr:hypothetical protein [Chloroflexota bacterium]MCI0731090.1 hypothetical protein [Chloroflexota bacterium]